MDDVERAGVAVDVTAPAEEAAAPAPLKPWIRPRFEAGKVADQTEGARGAGSDAGHCLS